MRRGNRRNRLADRYIGSPVLFVLSLFKRRKCQLCTFERIGVLGSPGIGDTLLCSGSLTDLRSQFPGAQIIYFSPHTSYAAALLLPCLDGVVQVNLTRLRETMRTIRQYKLDAIVDITPWPRLTAFYAALSGAKVKAGFRVPGQYRHLNYDIVIDHSKDCHESENFQRLFRAFGVPTKAALALELATGRLSPSLGEGRRIVFHPWASGDQRVLREWPENRWIDLALRLDAPGRVITITGGPADRDRCEVLRDRLAQHGMKAESYCSESDLRLVASVLRTSELVVSVNTGIMHLAAIAGAPTVSLNGPTATHRYGPIGPCVASAEPKGGGGGYLHFGFEFDGKSRDTMSRITIEEVLRCIRLVAPSICRE